MGGNGTFSKGHVLTEEQRQWKTIDTLPADSGFPEVAVLEMKKREHVKTPPESSTENRAYVVFKTDGSDVRELSLYDANHKKTVSIHTKDHHDLKEHYHEWKDGAPVGEPKPLTPELERFLNHVRRYKKKY